MGQADPILNKLGAGPAVKKLVETALILSNSSRIFIYGISNQRTRRR